MSHNQVITCQDLSVVRLEHCIYWMPTVSVLNVNNKCLLSKGCLELPIHVMTIFPHATCHVHRLEIVTTKYQANSV